MEIDWSKENPAVKEACDYVIKAHTMHKTMTPEEQQRMNFLLDMLLPDNESGE